MAKKSTKSAKKATNSTKKAKKQPSNARAGNRRIGTSTDVNSSLDGLGASMKASFRSQFLRKSR